MSCELHLFTHSANVCLKSIKCQTLFSRCLHASRNRTDLCFLETVFQWKETHFLETTNVTTKYSVSESETWYRRHRKGSNLRLPGNMKRKGDLHCSFEKVFTMGHTEKSHEQKPARHLQTEQNVSLKHKFKCPHWTFDITEI